MCGLLDAVEHSSTTDTALRQHVTRRRHVRLSHDLLVQPG